MHAHVTEPIAVRVARRLRAARIQAGLTVREAAALLGDIDHSMIVKYENGTTRLSLERLAVFAAAYDLTPAALLAVHDNLMPIIAAIERADPEHLTVLATALDSLAARDRNDTQAGT